MRRNALWPMASAYIQSINVVVTTDTRNQQGMQYELQKGTH